MRNLPNIFLICVFLLCSFVAIADKPRVKGYYVNMEGDTIKTQVTVVLGLVNKDKIEEAAYYYGVTCYEKGKAMVLDGTEAVAFGFTYMGKRYDFRFVREVLVPTLGHMKDEGTFLRLMVRGACDLFYVANVSFEADEYFFRRGDGDNYLTKNNKSILNRDKEIAKFFDDCPELAEKIKNKGFQGDERYIEMVKYYNTRCQTLKSDE